MCLKERTPVEERCLVKVTVHNGCGNELECERLIVWKSTCDNEDSTTTTDLLDTANTVKTTDTTDTSDIAAVIPPTGDSTFGPVSAPHGKLCGEATFLTHDHAEAAVEFSFDTKSRKCAVRITSTIVYDDDVMWMATADPPAADAGCCHISLIFVEGGLEGLERVAALIAAKKASEVEKARVSARTYGPYQFPELGEDGAELLSRTKNCGFCFSGGGMRAFTASWGQLRALHKLGLFPKIRFFSSISGGNWATSLTLFRDTTLASDDDFFGEIFFGEPHSVDYAKLSAELDDKCMGQRAIHQDWSLTANVLRHMFPFGDERNGTSSFWNLAIEDRVLKPHGIDGSKIMTYNKRTLHRILNQQTDTKLTESDFLCPRADHPFPIVSSVLLSPFTLAPTPTTHLSTEMHLMEATPLNVGVPVPSRKVFFERNGDVEERVLFGGTVEPVAFGGVQDCDGEGHETVKRFQVGRAGRYSVAEVVGTSSTFYAGLASSPILNNLLPRAHYTSFPCEENPGSPAVSEEFAFGDGGLLDNFGLIPLLRRKVENIVVMINSQTVLSCLASPPVFLDESDFVEGKPPLCGDVAAIDDNLAAFFGYETETCFAGSVSSGMQVFRSKDLWPVVKQLQERARQNKPLVADVTALEVLSNAKHGVQSYVCNATFVYLGAPAKEKEECVPCGGSDTEIESVHRKTGFNAHLHDDVYDKVYCEQSRDFANFPNYKTFGNETTEVIRGLHVPHPCGLSTTQANLLSQFTSWTLMEYFQNDAEGKRVLYRLTGGVQQDTRYFLESKFNANLHSAKGVYARARIWLRRLPFLKKCMLVVGVVLVFLSLFLLFLFLFFPYAHHPTAEVLPSSLEVLLDESENICEIDEMIEEIVRFDGL